MLGPKSVSLIYVNIHLFAFTYSVNIEKSDASLNLILYVDPVLIFMKVFRVIIIVGDLNYHEDIKLFF